MRKLPDGTLQIDLAYSPCPNDTFMFDALVNGRIDTGPYRFDVHLEDVETLNQNAFSEKRDLTKLSFFAFGKVIDRYILLDAGSALGNGVGPLLITRPGTKLQPGDETIVAIPGENTTANFLFSLYYPHLTRKQPMVFSAIEDAVLNRAVHAGVIIHENRFTYEQRGLEKIRDLGEAWEQETGKPIPLGGIVAKRSLPATVLHDLNRLMAESVRYAFAHPTASADYVACHAQEMDPAVRQQHIDLYVNPYCENLGITGREAIRYLLLKAAATGILSVNANDQLFISELQPSLTDNS